MKNRIIIAICLIFVLAVLVFVWRRVPRQTSSNGGSLPTVQEQASEHLEADPELELKKGRLLLKAAPAVETAEWYAWFEKLSTREQLQYAAAVEEQQTPPPPKTGDVSAAQIKEVYAKDALKIFPAKMLWNYKPLLRMDEGVPVYALNIDTVRSANGLTSTIYARRASGSVVVEWNGGTVQKGNISNGLGRPCFFRA